TPGGGGPTGGFSGGVAAGGKTVPGTGATGAPGAGANGAPGVGTTMAPAGPPIAGPSVMTGPSVTGAAAAIGAPAQLGHGSLRKRLNSGRDVPQHPAVAMRIAATTARQVRTIAK